jgi:hydroxymethylpyrimidine pyrophosphatase-like HAD family hydrolase
MVPAANRNRAASARRAGGQVDPAEASFYGRYAWCLNPLLTFDDQLRKLGEELEYAATARPSWQRDECAINIYLLACGIACTVDDYLARHVWDLAFIAERFPHLRFAIPPLRRLLSLSQGVHQRLRDGLVVRWRERWARCVDMACDALVEAATPDGDRWSELRSSCEALRRTKLPRDLQWRRLRIPEGFRCQDLSHHDVLAMARRFAERHPERRGALAVIGVRTAGAYFAPLARAYLATRGWAHVSWLTIRPRQGLTRKEQQQLRNLGRAQAPLLVIDDYPNTGATLSLALTALARCGVPPERITIVTPRHPVQPDWALPREAPGADRVAVITLEPEGTYKARLLTPTGVAALLRDWFGKQGWQRIAVRTSRQVDAVNARLASHYRDGFQVRLQRLFEIELARDNEDAIVTHVVAKSVGWGWLGYHAYLAGTRLADFVPPVIGLRHGMLFSRWVSDLTDAQTDSPTTVPVATLAAYVAQRSRCLRLAEDPRLERHDAGWDGWTMLLAILRRVYGPYFGRLKISALWKALRRFASPQPILVDGRMRPGDWVERYKVDYEQHNFGPAELDVVDPAYDLASAIFEFHLDEQAECELLQAYARETCDGSVAHRVLLYKVLSGTRAMQQATYWSPRAPSEQQRAHWNRRYLEARNFLTYELHRACAGLLSRRREATWSGPLFFLDVDGVFDCEVLGFPHTTASGLAALALLRAQGFAIVLNSGRSVEHVRRYCDIYGLPGGVAEYGSVFVDAVGGRERACATPAALERLQGLREALRTRPGVFVDDGYRYAVRAYRYQGEGTVGLSASEVEGLLLQGECRGLACIATSVDTYFVQQGITKGTGVAAVKHHLGRAGAPVIAMGDSDQDVPMLEAAAAWYAPATCSPRVRELARGRGGHIMAGPKQRGFLEAAEDLARKRGILPGDVPRPRQPAAVRTATDLLVALLHAADRPRLLRFLAALTVHRL